MRAMEVKCHTMLKAGCMTPETGEDLNERNRCAVPTLSAENVQ